MCSFHPGRFKFAVLWPVLLLALIAGCTALPAHADTGVATWGLNTDGALGNNDPNDNSSNVPVLLTRTGVLQGKLITSVAMGESHGLALCSDGTLASWGYNGDGELGNGDTTGTNTNVPVLVNQTGVLAGKTVKQIACGDYFCLVLCTDGTLYSWGYNGDGDLGNGDTTFADQYAPVQVVQTGVLAGKTVESIAAGKGFSLALCADGTLFSWGYNGDGELGNGDNTFSDSPVPVQVIQTGVLAGKTISSISAGYFGLALCSNGTMATWGYGSDGELGNGLGESSNVPVLVTSTGVLSGLTVTQAVAGASAGFALCSNGTLVSWGYNTDGELGNGDDTFSDSLVPVAVTQSGVLSGKNVTTLAAGDSTTEVICADGTLATWGYNGDGELGNGDASYSDSNVPVLVTTSGVLSGKTATGIGAGGDVNLALFYNGNTPPTISAIANQIAATGGSTGPVSFTVADEETPAASLVVTAASSNTTVAPLSGITLGGAGANRTVSVVPAAVGTATITLTVTDGNGGTATSAFTLTAVAPAGITLENTAVRVGATQFGTAVFPVVLSAASTATITVNYATSNGTGTAGVDYTATTGTLTIPAGTTNTSISVTALGNNTDASGLTFHLTLSAPNNATITTGTALCTITHDSVPVSVSLAPTPPPTVAGTATALTATYSDGDGATDITTAYIGVGPTATPASSFQAYYSATTGLLYVQTATGTFIGGFAPGSTNVIAAPLGSLNCAATTVSLSGNQLVVHWNITPAAGLIGTPTTYLDVFDSFNETAGWTSFFNWTISPSAAINNVSVVTGPSGTQTAQFTVTLNVASPLATTLKYATANGTATAGSDYTATSGTLSIPAGATTGTISVPVAGGKTDASGLTFTVTLSSPVNAILATATGTATIIHDAAPTAVSVTPNPASSAVNTPELVTTTYSSVGGPSNLSSTGFCVGPLSSPSASLYAKYLPSTGLFYLANSSGTYAGGYAAGSANTITTTLGTLNLASTTVTTNGNQLVIGWNITPATGLIGTQKLYLIASDNFGLSSGWQNLGTWTVAQTSAAINSVSAVAGPSGTQHAVFTVTLTPTPTNSAKLNYATANGTATAGTDYTATSGTLTIPAGATTGTISVPIASGKTDASGLTFTVTLSNPVNAFIGTATGTATIIHDATPVAVSIAPDPAASLAGTPELLTATFSSVAGATNLSGVSLCAGPLSAPSASLYAKYVPATNLFYLANSSGTYIGGFAPGSANTITTTLGTLNLASTTVTQNGNQLIIGWDLTPTASLEGTQKLYLIASDNFGLSSGWQNLGTWTISPTSAAINSISAVAGPSGTQHAVFTVTLSTAATSTVSLGYATANGTATAGTDYTATTGTLTIPAGSTTGTISVPIAGGQTDASGLTFTVTLSNPVNTLIGTATGTATIVHDATPVAVSVSPNPANSALGAPELLTATYSSVGGAANLSGASLCIGPLGAPTTSLYAKYAPSTGLFYLANASGTYIGGYAAGSANTITTTLGTLNLAATTVTLSGNQLVIGWDVTPTASLVGTQDLYLIASDNFGLSSGWQNLGTWPVTESAAAINNPNVLAGPSGTQTAVFTVTVSPAPLVPITLTYATANGTATAGTDYTATSGSLTIPAGNATGVIDVPLAGGQTDGSGLTFTVTLSNAVNSTISGDVGIATIIHDADPVAVSVTPNPASSLVSAAEVLTTTYSSVGGAANIVGAGLCVGTLGSPGTSLYAKYSPATNLFYLANASGNYIGGFAPGSANTITTTLATLNLAGTTVTQNGNQLTIGWDLTPTSSLAGTQTVYLTATDSFGLTSGWQNLGTWTISAFPAASIGNTAILAGPSGTQQAVFTVTLTPAPVAAVSLKYATANGTATAGTDYTATTGTLTIPAGSTTGTISVPVAGGQTDASGLTFKVTLSSPVNATISTATGTATITHDAAPLAVSVTPNPANSPVSTPELLTATYSSVGGAANISGVGLCVGSLGSPGTSLYAKYVPSSNLFYLANASGAYIGGYAPGSANTIVTSLGSLNLAETTVTQSGNQLVIGWDLTPTTSLVGTQNIFLTATDSFGLSSGWQNLWTWTITSGGTAALKSGGELPASGHSS